MSTSIKRNRLKWLKNQNFQEHISFNEKIIPSFSHAWLLACSKNTHLMLHQLVNFNCYFRWQICFEEEERKPMTSSFLGVNKFWTKEGRWGVVQQVRNFFLLKIWSQLTHIYEKLNFNMIADIEEEALCSTGMFCSRQKGSGSKYSRVP